MNENKLGACGGAYGGEDGFISCYRGEETQLYGYSWREGVLVLGGRGRGVLAAKRWRKVEGNDTR